MSQSPKPPSAAALHAPLSALLRPLVRLCIRCGLTFPALADLLRELYINVAEHDFALSEKEQTDSRVSLLTGVHRKEVRRLRGAGAPVRQAPQSVSLVGQIAARWLAAPEFTDAAGRPRPLPRHGGDGAGPTFDDLVGSVTRDVRPRAVLDDWLERGLARIDNDGRVELDERAVAPGPGDERQLHFFGRNLRDHLAAAAENLVRSPSPFMERAVHYERLTPEAARELEAAARESANRSLLDLNRRAQELEGKGAGAGESRWIFGVYVYRDDGDGVSGQRGGDGAETS